MPVTMEKTNFEIANVILSQKSMFTFEDLVIQLRKKGIDIEEDRVKFTIKNLKNTGLLNDYGTKYSLSNVVTR